MSLLSPHLSSNQQLAEAFTLSLPVAFSDIALGTSVVFCIFAIWCWGCVCFSFPVLRSPILYSHVPSSLCSCSLLASRLLFLSCAFKVLHLPRVLLIISILLIICWSSSLLNPFRKGAEGRVSSLFKVLISASLKVSLKHFCSKSAFAFILTVLWPLWQSLQLCR